MGVGDLAKLTRGRRRLDLLLVILRRTRPILRQRQVTSLNLKPSQPLAFAETEVVEKLFEEGAVREEAGAAAEEEEDPRRESAKIIEKWCRMFVLSHTSIMHRC